MLHALVLGFLQPAVPLLIFVALAPWLFDAAGDLRTPGPSALAVTLLVPLVAHALLIGGGLVVVGRVSLRELGWRRPDSFPREVALGIVGLALYIVVFAVVTAVKGQSGAVIATAVSYPILSRVLLLIAGAHIAFFEETVFRGYLQPCLVARLGGWGGVMATAVVFAAWHPPYFHLHGFLIRLTLGLITGALRGKDRSLVAPFVVHATLWAVVGLA